MILVLSAYGHYGITLQTLFGSPEFVRSSGILTARVRVFAPIMHTRRWSVRVHQGIKVGFVGYIDAEVSKLFIRIPEGFIVNPKGMGPAIELSDAVAELQWAHEDCKLIILLGGNHEHVDLTFETLLQVKNTFPNIQISFVHKEMSWPQWAPRPQAAHVAIVHRQSFCECVIHVANGFYHEKFLAVGAYSFDLLFLCLSNVVLTTETSCHE